MSSKFKMNVNDACSLLKKLLINEKLKEEYIKPHYNYV